MPTELHRLKRREYYAQNKDKVSAYRRNYRARTNNQSTKKYEKTKKGFLMRCYRNMQSRICGVQKLKAHLYLGKDLLPRQDFYEWAFTDKEFNRLFKEWEEQGYPQKLSPSINRIDSDLGYELSNMEWLTHSENSRRTKKYLSHNTN